MGGLTVVRPRSGDPCYCNSDASRSTLEAKDATMDRGQCRSPKDQKSGHQPQRRRQKIPDKGNLICQVCGDKANGYNFGAVTCESCKAFFRRNALKHQDIKCAFDEDCKIDPFTRKFCTACRLKRCSDINMKKEWILDEASLKKRKRMTRRRPTEESSGESSENSRAIMSSTSSACNTADVSVSSVTCTNSSESTASTDCSPLASPATRSRRTSARLEEMRALSPTSTNECSIASSASGTVTELVPLSAEDSITISTITKNHMLTVNPLDQPSWTKMTAPPTHAHDAINMADSFIRRFIKFLKTIPEFLSLCQDDQICLLKGGIMETLVIRSAITFDASIGGFKVESAGTFEQHQLKLSMIFQGLGKDIHDEHLKFITSFNTIALWNKTTLVLAMLINIFSPDRLGLLDKRAVAAAEERYSQLLQRYLHSLYRPSEAAAMYPRLLMKLTDARTYGELSSKQVAQVNAGAMEPLMREIFNVSS